MASAITEYVEIKLRSPADWSSIERAQQLASILLTEDSFLRPEEYCDKTGLRSYPFDEHNLAKLYEAWESQSGHRYFTRRKPFETSLDVHDWLYREFEQFNEVTGYFDERYFLDEDKDRNLQELVTFAKRLYSWGQMVHGYVCHLKDWEAKHYFGRPTRVASGREVSAGGLDLREGLPGIYWANFFGPKYVHFLGRDKFATVPAYHKEELPDGGFLLLTSASPLEYLGSEVRRLERAILDHLGRDAFFDKAHPRRRCRTPEFEFEQPSFGGPIVAEEIHPHSIAIPYPQLFISEVPRLAAALNERFEGALDYSPQSVQLLDTLILKEAVERPEPWDDVEGRQLLQELVAYYGEVLRRHLRGKWVVVEKGDHPYPAIRYGGIIWRKVEAPFDHILELWDEHDPMRSLSNTLLYLSK